MSWFSKERRGGWALAGICLLLSTRWLLEGADPRTASTLFSEALGCLLVAALPSVRAFAQSGRKATPGPRVNIGALRSGTGLALALSGFAIGQAAYGRMFGASNLTLALALTTVVVGVAGIAASETQEGSLAGRLWPGLAGLAGLLLLFPQPAYSGWRFWAGLVLVPVLTGLGAVMGRGGTRVPDSPHGIQALGLIGAAAIFAVLGVHEREMYGPVPVHLAAVALDGATAYLSLQALDGGGSFRWSAQFLIVPLITLIEGLAFLRPILDGRSWFALGLLALSGAYQVWAVPDRTPGQIREHVSTA